MSYVTSARRHLSDVSLSRLAFAESLEELRRLALTFDPTMDSSERFVYELPEAVRAARQSRGHPRPWMVRIEDEWGPDALEALQGGPSPQ